MGSKCLGKFMVIVCSLGLVLALGCASGGGKVQPPSPPEANLLAYSVMTFALTAKEVSPEKLAAIESIMQDSKGILLQALKEDPQNLDQARLNYLAGKDPALGALANTVLQVLIYRLKPLIDTGKTDLAAQYIESVLDGALEAIAVAKPKPDI